MQAAGHDRIAELGATARSMPLTMSAYGLAAVSLIGLPPSAGFLGKWLLLTSALEVGQWLWGVILVIGGLFTAAYLLRPLMLSFAREDALPVARSAPTQIIHWMPLFLAMLSVGLGLCGEILLELLDQGAPFELEPSAVRAVP